MQKFYLHVHYYCKCADYQIIMVVNGVAVVIATCFIVIIFLIVPIIFFQIVTPHAYSPPPHTHTQAPGHYTILRRRSNVRRSPSGGQPQQDHAGRPDHPGRHHRPQQPEASDGMFRRETLGAYNDHACRYALLIVSRPSRVGCSLIPHTSFTLEPGYVWH